MYQYEDDNSIVRCPNCDEEAMEISHAYGTQHCHACGYDC